MKRYDVLPLTIILAAFLSMALAYCIVVPPFEGLDEIEHFGVTRYVAKVGQLPVEGDPALEAWQGSLRPLDNAVII